MRIIIMCKAPIAGKVKTRLMPHYSAEQAAQLHMAMATTVIERAKRLFDDVIIAADDCSHPFFAGFALPLQPQGEGNLGDRMQRLMQRAFAEGVDGFMLLGTDSPHMRDQRLLNAASSLQQYDVVVGPVEDGGYDLIAMSRPWPVFEAVSWSSEQVLQQTIAHIDSLSLTSLQMDISFDVDFPADIERAKQAGWLCRDRV